MMDLAEMGKLIDRNFTRELFRLETLDQYDVGSDGDDLQRYLDGKAAPDAQGKQAWLDHIREEVSKGLHTYRVHVVQGPLSDYLRYECEWGYTYNSDAGEHIRILDLAEVARPDDIVDEDFWLIDDRIGIQMHYSPAGVFQGASVAGPDLTDRYRRARQAAWNAARPFNEYWNAHPEYWQSAHAAA